MLKFVNSENEIDYNNTNAITVQILQNNSNAKLLKKISENITLIFVLDTKEIVDIDEIIKKIIFLFQVAIKNNTDLGKLDNNEKVYGYIIKENSGRSKQFERLFMELFKILEMKDIMKMYSYIYDAICEDLDDKFSKFNYCDFSNDKCIAQRAGVSAHSTMGCCYMHTYSKIMSMPIDLGICKFLDNKKCVYKCITCKLFTCKYLRDRGIKFSIKDYMVYRNFFNKKQYKILEKTFFTPKEKIIELLIRENKV